MLKNYFKINEDTSIETFLKTVNEKKNSTFIILDDEKSFVDFKIIALKVTNINEKLKKLKKPLSTCESDSDEERTNRLIETGDNVIKTNDGIFDYIDALKYIIQSEYDFLDENIEDVITQKEVYALNEDDKISSAKSLFVKHKVNLLPVIKGLKIIGEVRARDLLVNSLFTQSNKSRGDYFDENKNNSTMSLPVSNIMMTKPHTVSKKKTVREAVEKMINKTLPSIIVTENDELYSILSSKDVFKLVKLENETIGYDIEIVGSSNLFEDELDLIEDFANKTMVKIAKVSDYKNLKVTLKTMGNTEGTHMRKINAKILLSHGNKIISLEKEISAGKADELRDDHDKENWNIPKMLQEAFKTLEKRVREEKEKHK